jgi:hypothetical protein
MEAPIVAMLRLIWRLRAFLAITFLIVLAHFWINDAIRAWDNWHKPVEYCDDLHQVPFVPADKCGGMSSCDRVFMMGQKPPNPCPTQP